MLKSYEAVYEEGKLRWVREQPPAKRMKVIVTVLEEETDTQRSTRQKSYPPTVQRVCEAGEVH